MLLNTKIKKIQRSWRPWIFKQFLQDLYLKKNGHAYYTHEEGILRDSSEDVLFIRFSSIELVEDLAGRSRKRITVTFEHRYIKRGCHIYTPIIICLRLYPCEIGIWICKSAVSKFKGNPIHWEKLVFYWIKGSRGGHFVSKRIDTRNKVFHVDTHKNSDVAQIYIDKQIWKLHI